MTAASGRTLAGGEGSEVVGLGAGPRRLVRTTSPAWRTVAELAWAYELAAYAAGTLPEAAAPCAPASRPAVVERLACGSTKT